MITTEKYEKLLNMGLSLDHYFVLVKRYNGEKLPNLKRVQGFVNLLTKKGLLIEGILTEQAVKIVQDDIANKGSTEKSNYSTWVAELHKKCQNKIIELTGKKQVRGKINGSAHSFFPGILDFSNNLQKVIVRYKIKDFNLIEYFLIKHIEDCNKSNNWFPTLYYYILKNGKSGLVTDIESYDEKELNNNDEERSGQFDIVDTKSLF